MVPQKNFHYSISKLFGIGGVLSIIIGFIIYFYGSNLRVHFSTISDISTGELMVNLSYILIVFGFVFITIAGVIKFLEPKPIQDSHQKFCSECGEKFE